MSEPVVRAAIVCRDGGRQLEAAVDSLYAQSLPAAELLVVDDGSLDPFTRRLLDGYRWPRLRVVRQPRPHAARARNLALREVGGDLVCLLDAADRLAPDFLARAVEALRGEPAASFAVPWYRTCGALEVEIRAAGCGPADLLAGTLPDAALWRREPVLAAGGFDESLADGDETAELRVRLGATRREGLVVREVLLSRAIGPGAGAPPGVSNAFATRHEALFAAHAGLIASRRGELLAAFWHARPAAQQAAVDEASFELNEARRHIAGLEHALAYAHRRLADLGGSWSWRLTAPLRAVHARLTRAGRR